ncbi:MAG: zinc metallopeptidase [Marvinbryantia sp.]|uniref:zinc metallopeptidase n=1 Tax=Marvinbryantia sp. TaxID=2496532 RepID=UPI0025FF2BE0|nr:zinc metallopeptidase [uncultured Marvinbryantia sp.]
MMLLSYANNFFGYGYGYRGLYFDPTMILALLGLILTMIASAGVNSTFAKYNKVRCMRGMTGAEAAQQVLHAAGIFDVQIRHVRGNLTDHYDPRNKTLNLSDSTFSSNSVAAVCVAAHECGHAVQDQKKYGPLVLRSTLVPLANFGSQLSWPVFIAGLIFSLQPLVMAGIILFSLAVLFQLVTLPVEFNASSRALRILEDTGMLGSQEMTGAKKVLRAAAMTYVAALASSLLQLLRLILLSRRNDRD